MPFEESLAARIRRILARKKGVKEKKMFGIGFLLNGNLVVGVWKDLLIVRLGPDGAEEAIRQPNVEEFHMNGKAMKDWVVVAPEGIENDEQLRAWIQRAVTFVGKLSGK